MNKRVVTGIVIIILIVILSVSVSINFLKSYNSNKIDNEIVINLEDSKSDNSADNIIKKPSNYTNGTSIEEVDNENTITKRNGFVIEPIMLDNDDFSVSVNGTNVSLDGTIIKRAKNQKQGLNTGSYVTLKVYVPDDVSSETLENMKITLPQSGNITYTEKDNKILESKKSDNPYFYITQEFMSGQNIPFIIDWGNGKEIIYNVTFNLEVR